MRDASICVWLLFCRVSPRTASIPGGIKERADQPSAAVQEDKHWGGLRRRKLNTEGKVSVITELKAFMTP